MIRSSADRTDEFYALARQRGWKAKPVLREPTAIQAALRAFETQSAPPQQVETALRSLVQQQCTDAPNQQAYLHWTEVNRLLQPKRAAPTKRTGSVVSRAGDLGNVEKSLYELSQLFDVVMHLTERQGILIGDLERNVDTIALRVDAARDELEDAAPRLYRTRRWRWYLQYMPTTLMQRLRCILFLAMSINVLFVIMVLF